MAAEPEALPDPLRQALRAELAPAFAEMRAFVDRRIAELSAEVHASVELADMAERNLASELGQVRAGIAQLVAIPAASTRNSGLELEAVVEATEAAAGTILDAAEAIQAWVETGARDPAALGDISARVGRIFEACGFQDITGQRIRRAIAQLRQVETMLGELAPAPAPGGPPAPVGEGADLQQRSVDALLAG